MAKRSPLIRRYALGVTAIALAAILLAPAIGRAQTPSGSNSSLLQPSLLGNPANPPRFRRSLRTPAPNTFTAPSRIGATPTYGSPTGFGAGNTGFDSSNTPRARKKKPAAPPPAFGATQIAPPPETTFTPLPTVTPPPQPVARRPVVRRPPQGEVYPLKAAYRQGATLPAPVEPLPISNPPAEVHPLTAANRPGSILPLPPPSAFEAAVSTPPPGEPPLNTLPLGKVPLRPLPVVVGDAYAPLGIRTGAFLLLPAVDLSVAHSTNPEATPGGPPSWYFVVAPELQVHSDWERHALDINMHGSYSQYTTHLVPSLNVPYLDTRINGRIDVLRDTQIIIENRVIVATDNPGSPNLQAGLAILPINVDAGATLGVQQQFNRLSVSLKGTFDRTMYQNSLLTDGEISSNGDRTFDQYAGILRLGYDLNPSLKPFVEVQEDARIHDEQFDRNHLERDSTGSTAKIGSGIDMFGSLTGEAAIGYTTRHYQDPTLPNINGIILNGAMLWQATPLTTAKLTATSQVYETVLAGTTGTLTRDLTLQVDHAFLRWLIGTVKAGYGSDVYVGSQLLNKRYFVSGGLTYKLNPDMQLKGEVRQDWLTSTEPGFAYTATSFLFGLRLQR